MKKLNVWLEKEAIELLENAEPSAAVVQNCHDIEVPFARPSASLVAAELVIYEPVNAPVASKKLVLDIESAKGFSDKERAKIDEAKRIYEIVVNSPLYWEKIEKSWHLLTETKNFSFEEFKILMLSGDCKFSDADGETDIALVMYHRKWSKVVGYVMGDSNMIHINRKYFSSPLSIASNLNHEALHLLGFSHYGTKSTSIPYVVGNDLFEETWKELLKKGVA